MKKIQSKPNISWRYVPTDCNPADVASRGGEVKGNELWLNGPDWLKDNRSWPDDIVTQSTKESEAEAKVIKTIMRVAQDNSDCFDHILEKFALRIQGHRPIYLPDKHIFTTKVIEDAHLRTLHGGVGMNMAKVREQYWVPRLRQLTRKIIKNCNGCRRFQANAVQQPPPGLLPQDRTAGSRPFETIGVDFAGPIKYVKRRKDEGKAYVLLYGCSLTRAVYLELMPSLDTTKFIESFKQFIARKGRPNKVYSDNAKTFVSAANWLRKAQSDEKLNEFLSKNRIKWQFNLSRAPWWGGQFERLIGLVKRALYKTIGQGSLRWDELQEVLLDIEVALNGRPLSYVEDDVELPTLTPKFHAVCRLHICARAGRSSHRRKRFAEEGEIFAKV